MSGGKSWLGGFLVITAMLAAVWIPQWIGYDKEARAAKALREETALRCDEMEQLRPIRDRVDAFQTDKKLLLDQIAMIEAIRHERNAR